jgi:uncharacterized membrane protein
LTTIAAVLVWLLWAANAVNDLVQKGQLGPFTIVMPAGLLGGQILVWLGVVPNPMPRRWVLVTYSIIGIVIVGLAAYLLAGLLLGS